MRTKTIYTVLAIFALLALNNFTAKSQQVSVTYTNIPTHAVDVRIGVPAPPVQRVWVEGYWAWDKRRRCNYWVDGYWTNVPYKPAHVVYVPDHHHHKVTTVHHHHHDKPVYDKHHSYSYSKNDKKNSHHDRNHDKHRSSSNKKDNKSKPTSGQKLTSSSGRR